MAVLAAAALLDELMGRNRNIAPHEKCKELNWEDDEFCKYYMVKFCPHDLFVNTKADLGTCQKVHDEEARKKYEDARPSRKLQYQEEFLRFCNNMLNDVERKIQKGKQRLALSGKGGGNAAPSVVNGIDPAAVPAKPAPPSTAASRNQDHINILSERINGLEEEAEKSGNDGNVEEAQGLMKLCDQLRDERDKLIKQGDSNHWSTNAEIAAAQEKQMEVCEVCGAFLIVGDAQQRIEDHLMGKQHMGYARLKAAIEEMSVIVNEVKEEKRASKAGGLGSTPTVDDRQQPRHRDREHHRGPRKERSRSPQRERREKERRSGESRDHRRDRDRREDRDREHRERKHRSDRDAGRRDRDSGSNRGQRSRR